VHTARERHRSSRDRLLGVLEVVTVNVLIWGAVAMVVIGLLFARRRTRRSELAQWHRAAARMDRLCPPANDSATLWCKVVAAPSVIELPEQVELPEQLELPEQ